MSHRTGITQAIANKMATDITGRRAYLGNPQGVKGYRLDLGGSVSTKFKNLDEINEFPYVSISPSAEFREDHPANFSWGMLSVYIRIFVRSEDDAEEQLEKIISDVELFVDRNRDITYYVEQIDSLGNLQSIEQAVTDITIRSITTDEGLLAPDGIGEILLDVRYEKIRNL